MTGTDVSVHTVKTREGTVAVAVAVAVAITVAVAIAIAPIFLKLGNEWG